MIFGIGCDVCALDHLEKSLSGPHAAAFVRRVYGPAECTALALDTPLPAGHSGAHRLASAAADFAAKEAFLKAAGTGLREPFALREIEAVRLESGAGLPVLRGHGPLGGRPRPDRPPLAEPRRRHGAGFLHSGDGSGNLTALCAYNGIRPAA